MLGTVVHAAGAADPQGEASLQGAAAVVVILPGADGEALVEQPDAVASLGPERASPALTASTTWGLMRARCGRSSRFPSAGLSRVSPHMPARPHSLRVAA